MSERDIAGYFAVLRHAVTSGKDADPNERAAAEAITNILEILVTDINRIATAVTISPVILHGQISVSQP